MNLAQALRILPSSGSEQDSNLAASVKGIAFVGAGGKTSAMFQLARQLHPPVVVTATTHLGAWQTPLADRHIVANSPAPLESIEQGLGGVMLVTGEVEEDRTHPIDAQLLLWLREFCGYHSLPLLIEADGSRQKPLKAPGAHEPPIPPFVETVIVVAGLHGLGRPLDDEFVHRPEIFARLSGLRPEEKINTAALVRVLIHPEGGMKNIPTLARRVVLLNQADTAERQAQAQSISGEALKIFDSAIIANLEEGHIHAVREPIAGIVLAAGGSVRYGKPKQLLDWHGEPMVRAVAKTALDAGLSPVLLVSGANADKIEAAVKDLSLGIIRNQGWQSGQASSIRAGINALTGLMPDSPAPGTLNRVMKKVERSPGGAIFLLADQPQVTPAILRALAEEHASTLAPIVAPMVIDRRANPVLFDRSTFLELLKLEGDVGGRAIFSKYKVTYLPWHDEALLLDVDTPEHYQHLKDLWE